MNYPGRKTMWMIIGGIVVVGGAFAFSQYHNVMSAQIQYTSPSISASAINAPSTYIDDGDWQKILVGTDSATAGMGKSLGTGKASTNNAPLTETDKLGQALFAQYVSIGQSGAAINSDNVNAAVSQVLNDPNIITPPKVYTFADIKIGKDDSMSANLSYGTALGKLFINNNPNGNNEAVDARNSVEQHDSTILTKIDPIITDYRNILGGLLAISAPPSVASIHVDFVNAMSKRLNTAELLRKIDTDPAAGLRGAGQYTTGVQDISSAFTELKQYLTTRGLTFGTTTTASAIPGLGGQ